MVSFDLLNGLLAHGVNYCCIYTKFPSLNIIFSFIYDLFGLIINKSKANFLKHIRSHLLRINSVPSTQPCSVLIRTLHVVQ